jgi:hypothetical protein
VPDRLPPCRRRQVVRRSHRARVLCQRLESHVGAIIACTPYSGGQRGFWSGWSANRKLFGNALEGNQWRSLRADFSVPVSFRELRHQPSPRSAGLGVPGTGETFPAPRSLACARSARTRQVVSPALSPYLTRRQRLRNSRYSRERPSKRINETESLSIA